mmetsp:Transcript_1817/g.6508  ORF Transcript_1817/g.6508 Transcript_1817/m.6508 type:complete len:224 (+) Transcript_1817:475-1146(+)
MWRLSRSRLARAGRLRWAGRTATWTRSTTPKGSRLGGRPSPGSHPSAQPRALRTQRTWPACAGRRSASSGRTTGATNAGGGRAVGRRSSSPCPHPRGSQRSPPGGTSHPRRHQSLRRPPCPSRAPPPGTYRSSPSPSFFLPHPRRNPSRKALLRRTSRSRRACHPRLTARGATGGGTSSRCWTRTSRRTGRGRRSSSGRWTRTGTRSSRRRSSRGLSRGRCPT